MPNKNRTHSENCKVVCIVCFRKPKELRNITDSVRDLIEKHILSDLSDQKWSWLPTTICGGCRNKLSDMNKDPKSGLTYVDYDSLQPPQTHRLRSDLFSNTVTRAGLSTTLASRERRAEMEEEANYDCSVCSTA